MRRNQRIALLIGAVFVMAAGFAAALSSSGSSHHTPGDRFARVHIIGCKPRGGIQSVIVNRGDRLHLTISSDCADEIHVHGYNIKQEVPRGGSTTFNFQTTIEGIFVVELESRSEQIASLEVKP